jgi:hypothetical protein
MATKGFAVCEAVNLIVSVVQAVSQKDSGDDLHDVKLNDAINSVKDRRKMTSLIILVLYRTKIR